MDITAYPVEIRWRWVLLRIFAVMFVIYAIIPYPLAIAMKIERMFYFYFLSLFLFLCACVLLALSMILRARPVMTIDADGFAYHFIYLYQFPPTLKAFTAKWTDITSINLKTRPVASSVDLRICVNTGTQLPGEFRFPVSI